MAKPILYICGVLCVSGCSPGCVTYIVLTNAGTEVYNPSSPPVPEMVRKYIDKYIARAVHLLPDVILISDHDIAVHG